MRTYFWLLCLPPAGYLLLLIALYLFQGALLFLPARISDEQMQSYGTSKRWLPVPLIAEDGTRLNAWHLPAKNQGRGVVIYAHGNAGTVFDALEWKTILQDRGWHVLSVAYRGYPGSDGRPSEWGLKQDISAAYSFARSELGMTPQQIVFHGRSLGGGVVGTVMLDVPSAGLILESTFTSVVDRASELYPYIPVRWLLRHRFDTASRASDYTRPVFVIHSTADEVIPVAHGQALHRVFPSSSFMELTGYGHNEPVLGVEDKPTERVLSFLSQCVPQPKERTP